MRNRGRAPPGRTGGSEPPGRARLTMTSLAPHRLERYDREGSCPSEKPDQRFSAWLFAARGAKKIYDQPKLASRERSRSESEFRLEAEALSPQPAWLGFGAPSPLLERRGERLRWRLLSTS